MASYNIVLSNERQQTAAKLSDIQNSVNVLKADVNELQDRSRVLAVVKEDGINTNQGKNKIVEIIAFDQFFDLAFIFFPGFFNHCLVPLQSIGLTDSDCSLIEAKSNNYCRNCNCRPESACTLPPD